MIAKILSELELEAILLGLDMPQDIQNPLRTFSFKPEIPGFPEDKKDPRQKKLQEIIAQVSSEINYQQLAIEALITAETQKPEDLLMSLFYEAYNFKNANDFLLENHYSREKAKSQKKLPVTRVKNLRDLLRPALQVPGQFYAKPKHWDDEQKKEYFRAIAEQNEEYLEIHNLKMPNKVLTIKALFDTLLMEYSLNKSLRLQKGDFRDIDKDFSISHSLRAAEQYLERQERFLAKGDFTEQERTKRRRIYAVIASHIITHDSTEDFSKKILIDKGLTPGGPPGNPPFLNKENQLVINRLAFKNLVDQLGGESINYFSENMLRVESFLSSQNFSGLTLDQEIDITDGIMNTSCLHIGVHRGVSKTHGEFSKGQESYQGTLAHLRQMTSINDALTGEPRNLEHRRVITELLVKLEDTFDNEQDTDTAYMKGKLEEELEPAYEEQMSSGETIKLKLNPNNASMKLVGGRLTRYAKKNVLFHNAIEYLDSIQDESLDEETDMLKDFLKFSIQEHLQATYNLIINSMKYAAIKYSRETVCRPRTQIKLYGEGLKIKEESMNYFISQLRKAYFERPDLLEKITQGNILTSQLKKTLLLKDVRYQDIYAMTKNLTYSLLTTIVDNKQKVVELLGRENYRKGDPFSRNVEGTFVLSALGAYAMDIEKHAQHLQDNYGIQKLENMQLEKQLLMTFKKD